MKISLGSFYAADSPLHRGDPRVKLTGMLVLMVAIFLLNRPLALSAYAVFLVALILLSRIPLKVVLKSVRPILFILLFAFIVNLLTADGGRLFSLRAVAHHLRRFISSQICPAPVVLGVDLILVADPDDHAVADGRCPGGAAATAEPHRCADP